MRENTELFREIFKIIVKKLLDNFEEILKKFGEIHKNTYWTSFGENDEVFLDNCRKNGGLTW